MRLETEADANAQTKARVAAAGACHGDDDCGEGESCAYVEELSELLDTEVRKSDSGQLEYRSQARSEGSCGCVKRSSAGGSSY